MKKALLSIIILSTALSLNSAAYSIDMDNISEYVIKNIHDEPIAKKVYIEPPNLFKKIYGQQVSGEENSIEYKLRGQLHASIQNPAKYEPIQYMPTADDNYLTISSRFNIPIEQIVEANPNNNKEILSLTDPITIPQTTIDITNTVSSYATKAFNIVTMGMFNNKQDEMFKSMPLSNITYPLAIQTYVSSKYGYRRWHRFHHGVDLVAPIGTEVLAAKSGVVIYAKRALVYGRLLKIKTYDGHIMYYAHCSRLLVSEGQEVTEGTVIALSGNSGRSTGPHLHFEIRDLAGNTINPMPLLGIDDTRKPSATIPPHKFYLQSELEKLNVPSLSLLEE